MSEIKEEIPEIKEEIPEIKEEISRALYESGLWRAVLDELANSRENYARFLVSCQGVGVGDNSSPGLAAAVLEARVGGDKESLAKLLSCWNRARADSWPDALGADGGDARLRALGLHLAGLADASLPELYPDAAATASALVGATDSFSAELSRAWGAFRDLLAGRELLFEAAETLETHFGRLKDAIHAKAEDFSALRGICERKLAKILDRLARAGIVEGLGAEELNGAAEPVGLFAVGLPGWLARVSAALELEAEKAEREYRRQRDEEERLAAAESARREKRRKVNLLVRVAEFWPDGRDKAIIGEALLELAEKGENAEPRSDAALIVDLIDGKVTFGAEHDDYFERYSHGFARFIARGGLAQFRRAPEEEETEAVPAEKPQAGPEAAKEETEAAATEPLQAGPAAVAEETEPVPAETLQAGPEAAKEESEAAATEPPQAAPAAMAVAEETEAVLAEKPQAGLEAAKEETEAAATEPLQAASAAVAEETEPVPAETPWTEPPAEEEEKDGSEGAAEDDAARAERERVEKAIGELKIEIIDALNKRQNALPDAELLSGADEHDFFNLVQLLEKHLISEKDFASLYWFSRADKSHFSRADTNQDFIQPWLAETLYYGANGNFRREESKTRLSELFGVALRRVKELSDVERDLLTASLIRPAPTIEYFDVGKLLNAMADKNTPKSALWEFLRELGDLAARIQRGELVLGEEIVSEAAAEEALDADLSELREKTNKWRENAPHKRNKYIPASSVFYALVSPEGELSNLITYAENAVSDAELKEIAKVVNDWKKESYRKKKIGDIRRELNGPGAKEIVAGALKQLLDGINVAVKLADEWIRLNQKRLRGGRERSNLARVQEILASLASKADSASRELGHSRSDPAQSLLYNTLSELAGDCVSFFARSQARKPSPEGLPELETKLKLWLLKANSQAAETDGEDLSFSDFIKAFKNNASESDNCLRQLSGGAVHLVAAAVALDPKLAEKDDPEVSERNLGDSLRAACATRLEDIREEIVIVQDSVEERYVWGGLQRAKRDSLVGEMDNLSQRMDSLAEGLGKDGKAALWSQPLTLSELAKIQVAARRSLEELKIYDAEAMDEVERALDEFKSLPRVPEDAVNLIREMIDHLESAAALDQMTRFRDLLDRGEPIKIEPERAVISFVEDFYDDLERIHREGAASHPGEGHAAPDSLLSLWRRLGEEPLNFLSTPFWTSILKQFLRGLGFSFHESVKLEKSVEGAPYFWTRLDPEEMTIDSILPLWGSKRDGRHTLAFGWGNIGVDQIAQFVNSPGVDRDASLFVFCFTRLNRSSRVALGRQFRRAGRCPVVIDDNLIDWLARREFGSLDMSHATLEAGAAGGYFNPYTPNVAGGGVPKEMFYGRRDDIEKLWDKYGPCLLYGGRQLGKSAILCYLEREHHAPEKGDYVIYESAGDTPLNAIISEMLEKAGLGCPKANAKARELGDHIHKVLKRDLAKKTKRILFLIDESDLLLDAERAEKFANLAVYRDVMQQTDRDFKIVLAGLHSVQRFQHYPNNPLKHYGDPLRVGPLAPADAYNLIARPMKALGVVFAARTLVHRVLYRANYHPSLLQLACHALVEHVLKNLTEDEAGPPFMIANEVIDDVFRKAELQNKMRERFQWTVDLDPRYRVITYTIAYLESCGGSEDGREGLPATEVFNYLKIYWPQGFNDVEFDAVESLMSELEGLGILRRIADRFALRSHNILKLLQSDVDIETELDRFKFIDYVHPSGPEGARRVLPGTGARDPSPLSYAVESSFLTEETGASLIVGSEALGLGRAPLALETIYAERFGESSQGMAKIVRDSLSAAKQEGEVRRFFESRKNRGAERSIAVLVAGDPVKFWDAFDQASAFLWKRRCDAHFKLIGVVSPSAFISPLAASVLKKRRFVEIHYLERWNRNSVANFLDVVGLASDATSRVLKKTGGWDCLVLPELKGASNLASAEGTEGERLLAPPGFHSLAGFADPPPLYRALNQFFVNFGQDPFTEDVFVEYGRMYAREPDDGSLGFDPSDQELKDAFYFLRRLTLIVQDAPTEISRDAARSEASYRADAFYRDSLMADKTPE
ncbi:MAG: AAA family ATPase [Deltaproteobacteria bacterium]|nr:AAA family ATPase [Deltaproteobacteria bacterium]